LFWVQFLFAYLTSILQPPNHSAGSVKATYAEISSPGVAPSSSEISQASVATSADSSNVSKSAFTVAFVPRPTSDSLIPNVDLQKCVAASETSASVPSKRALLTQDSFPPSIEGADDDFVAEEEKWRTDRFFLGTVLYVTINPRALTEKCASGANCPFHPFCDFAHESSELRERPLTQMWNFKTKLCDKFHSMAACCPYGNRW
jgi:hypothetical protein